MSGLDYFTWFVLIVMALTLIIGFIVLAQLPGKLAEANRHPQAGAINMAGWLGLIFTAGFVWIAAMVWAKTKTEPSSVIAEEIKLLKKQITQLEADNKTLAENKP